MSRIPDEKIAEWKELADKATPGPWHTPTTDEAISERCGSHMGNTLISTKPMVSTDNFDAKEDNDYEASVLGSSEWLGVEPTDLRLMAAAREAIPALLDEREAMLSVLREVEWSRPAGVDGCPQRVPSVPRREAVPDREGAGTRRPRPRLPPSGDLEEALNCPDCGGLTYLVTPDYGYGYGAEFACYSCNPYGRRFTSSSAEAKKASAESRAASRNNASDLLK